MKQSRGGIPRRVVPAAAIELAGAFAEAGWPLYLVGGWVRDALGGNSPPDLDFATPAPPERSLEILTQTLEGTVLRRGGAPVDVRVRAWYNLDLVSAIFIVPGLIGALLMQTTVSVMASASVAE